MRKFLTLLALIVSVFALTACGGSHVVSNGKNPISMVGEWHQVNASPDGWMTASISGESIQVNLQSRDSSSIFWLGSFDTGRKSYGKFKVVSFGDQDAMKLDIAASTDKQKTFVYDNGVLSFDFSALGTSTTVRMIKGTSTTVIKPAPTKTSRSTSKLPAKKPMSPPKITLTKKK